MYKRYGFLIAFFSLSMGISSTLQADEPQKLKDNLLIAQGKHGGRNGHHKGGRHDRDEKHHDHRHGGGNNYYYYGGLGIGLGFGASYPYYYDYYRGPSSSYYYPSSYSIYLNPSYPAPYERRLESRFSY
ncbi:MULTISPECIES: hypothetical protein [unclassified Neochlamydia]|uniref:hypothetical protein n=1 Tax=unclassified Neochlamydia TaxID=2643326 RepID=UPI00140E4368|nr:MULTISPECIES: hypothetical protein [unclassified Neochlamydia]MBS4166913.1 Uncharacterized protein [Neochlamydia sp. AcF65]MBS4170620.1 Uncharacterized protein [Neochlamydia sp. AcF95]NGY95420.1 hypothetical protein [Neochlamydia sp. AcF84]